MNLWLLCQYINNKELNYDDDDDDDDDYYYYYYYLRFVKLLQLLERFLVHLSSRKLSVLSKHMSLGR